MRRLPKSALKFWEIGIIILLGQIVGLSSFFLQVSRYWEWQEVLVLILLITSFITFVYPISFILRLLDWVKKNHIQHKQEQEEWAKLCNLSCLRRRAQSGLIVTTRSKGVRSRSKFLVLGLFLGIITGFILRTVG